MNKKLLLSFVLFFLLAAPLFSAKNFTIYNSTNPTQAYFFIDGTVGNVGIGTQNALQKLHVVGDILANGTITSTTDLCIQGGNCLSNTGSMSSFILGGTSGTNQTISNGNVAFIAAGTAITTTAAATDRVIISVADNSIGNSQLAYDTGQHLTTSSSPTFSALTVSTINTGSGAMKLGDAAVANGDTNSIPTGDQVYDFVIGLGYGKGSVTGAGTTGYIPMWNGTTSQNNSMIFQNSTTVGIGYTGYSSTYELYVYGEAYASSYMRVGGDYLLDGGDIYDPSGDLHILAEDNLYLKTDYNNNDANYRAIIFAKDTTTSTVPTENNVLMSVNETGRVGINTSFANYTLHVYGNAYTSSSLGSGGSIYSANDIYTTGSDDDLWLGTSAQTSSRMRLYATGDLIANGTINAYDIRINGSVIGGGGGGAGNITGGGTANYIPRWTNASHLGNSLISQSSSVVYIGSSSSGLGVYTNGSIYDINEDKLTVLDALNVTGNNVTAKAFVYWSDARLKDNITVLKDSLAKVKQLEGVTFDWKDSGKHTIGLIAQDVEEVFPEAVSGEGEDFRYLEYGSLIAPIIESIKELDKKNERQDLEIQELKEEIELLKLQIATLSENQPCNLSEGLIVQYDVPVVEKEKSTLYKYFYVLLSRMF